MKTVKCKKCKEEIYKRAKVCPHCGARQTHVGCGIAVAIVSFVAAVVIIVTVVSSINGKPHSTETTNSSVTSESAGITVYDDENITVSYAGNCSYEKSVSEFIIVCKIVNKTGKNLRLGVAESMVNEYSVLGIGSGIVVKKDTNRMESIGFMCGNLGLTTKEDVYNVKFKINIYDEDSSKLIKTTPEISVDI